MQRGMAAWCGEKAMDAQGGQSHIQYSSGLDWALGQGSYFPTPLTHPGGASHTSAAFPIASRVPDMEVHPEIPPFQCVNNKRPLYLGPDRKARFTRTLSTGAHRQS